MEAKDANVDQAIQAQQATIQNLERQIGQLAKTVSDREKEKLPRTSQVNSREDLMAISIVSEQELDKETSVGEKPKEDETPSQENWKKPMVEKLNGKKEDVEE